MRFINDKAQIFIPDGSDEAHFSRTTHLAIGAHQDDIPIMAHHGILECFGCNDRWFTGITVTNGSGSPRSGLYADYSDEQMQVIRVVEEKKAAYVGEFGAAVLLDYSSSAVKDPADKRIVEELARLIEASAPRMIYTHNLADKHETHVAVALRTIAAVRSLPAGRRPEALYGCEVWRNLDWMVDGDKVAFDVSAHENLAAAIVGVYDSQISGGKRYDLATAGRRLANATFSESHAVDTAEALIYAMDLTQLITDPSTDINRYVSSHIERMQQEVSLRLTNLEGGE